ncbi:MAG: serine hydrolase [Acidobacteriaceae bacterium]|nr:serine hydrolase [Acidobacteriaceae bacterium]
MFTRRDFWGYAGTLAAATSFRAQAQGEGDDSQTDASGTCSSLCAQIDELMNSFMASQAISAGQLAVLSGSMLMSRGYSNPWQSRFPVNARSLFRLASCSKIFACAAIDALV